MTFLWFLIYSVTVNIFRNNDTTGDPTTDGMTSNDGFTNPTEKSGQPNVCNKLGSNEAFNVFLLISRFAFWVNHVEIHLLFISDQYCILLFINLLFSESGTRSSPKFYVNEKNYTFKLQRTSLFNYNIETNSYEYLIILPNK